LGAWTSWFLQAGEVFTTFTFLGMAGLAFSGGVAALYAPAYGVIGEAGLFFIAKRAWTLGHDRGYLTQADLLEDRFSSRSLSTLSAVLGVLFLLPYLQLQITGLSLIVRLVTGDTASGTLSMIAGSVLIVVFVLWSGLRGVASTSYVKDGLMVVVLVLLVVVIPKHFAGGVTGVFHRINELHPERLFLHRGANDRTWFITSLLVSAIGGGLLTLPHAWPALLSARNPKVFRRNITWMPVYALCLLLPIVIGFAAILVARADTDPNGVLLTLSTQVLPPWVSGLVVVAAMATAMVPAAAILIAVSSLVARNIVRVSDERRQLAINHAAVVTACALALTLGLLRPELLANLLLLTYSGSVQLAPAIVLALRKNVPVTKGPVLCGLVLGEAVVIWLTFISPGLLGTINVGLVGLVANVAVLGASVLVQRNTVRQPAAATEHV
jgi:SSS family solute:Na+ symporter